MTGIAATMTADGRPPEESLLTAMSEAISSRGNTTRGRYVVGDVGMVEVGDTSGAKEVRPVVHGSGAVYLVADAWLKRPDSPETDPSEAGDDRATSDQYRIARQFETADSRFAQTLQGMYGVVLHDQENRRLAVARDRFGVKPLYYTESIHGFAAASCPCALVRQRGGAPVLRDAARDELLQLQFTTGRETIFDHIYRVLPGETLVVSRGRVVERERVQSLPDGEPRTWSEGDALQELDGLLKQSVEDHLAGSAHDDLLLSGGVDSAVLLALLKERGGRDIRTFTIEVETKDAHREAVIAEDLAKKAGARHQTFHVGEQDFWTLLPKIVSAVEDPVADYAMLPLWGLAKAISGETSAVLTGDGADELFAGYGRYRSAVRPWWQGGRAMRHRGILDGTGILRRQPTGWRDGIVGAESNAAAVLGRTPLQVAQAVDVADWLPNDVLIKVDKCFIGHGIEPRMPFLDRRIADFAYMLGDDLKVRGRKGKYLLRLWLERHSTGLSAFRAKRGLSIPVGRWVGGRASELIPLITNQPGIREACNTDAIQKLFTARGRHVASAQWLLLFYALWHQIHILGTKPDGDVFAVLAEKT